MVDYEPNDHPPRERWQEEVSLLPYKTAHWGGGERVQLTYEDAAGEQQTYTAEVGEFASHNSWLMLFGEDQTPEYRTPDFAVRRDGIVLLEPYIDGDLFAAGYCISVERAGDKDQSTLQGATNDA